MRYILSTLLFLFLLPICAKGETLERFLSEKYQPLKSVDVHGFSTFGGVWEIQDGVLHGPAGSGHRLIYDGFDAQTLPQKQVRVDVEIFLEPNKSGNAAMVTNVGRCGVGADAFDGYEFALYANEQHVMLGRHEQNFKQLTSVPCKIPVGTWISVALQCTREAGGNRLELWVGDTLAASVLDENPLKEGKVGFRPWQRDVLYRNLKINRESIPLRSPETVEADYPPTLAVNDLPPILLVSRSAFGRPPAVGQDFWAGSVQRPGCALKVIFPSDATREVETIFEDPDGAIYDANLSYDAKTIYFSYRPKDVSYWHIYKICVDGTGLTQLTDGECYDFNPCPLSTGEIIFVSSRKGGFTVCQPGPASNLYKMSADGSDIQPLSMNTLSDFFPQVLADGRILFTRWEYIDRDLTYRQSLWTQNPDGTGYQLYFGNTVRNCGSFIQSRPIPGRSDLLVSTFGPHHGFPQGAIGLICRNYGPETELNVGYQYITEEFGNIRDTGHEWAYRDPFPLSESRFLCAYGSQRNPEQPARYGIYLLNREGEKRILYEESDVTRGCYNPIPLRPTPAPTPVASQLASADVQAEVEKNVGTLLLVDVYEGLSPFVKRGEVKKIRIMEQVRKSEDLASRAYDQSPVMSYATYYAKRCWGEVPVEADGSAYFEVPALREIYLQAIDAEGRELQRMTSALQTMPGQRQSCTGCHENRQSGPLSLKNSVQPLAAGRAPSVPQMPSWWQSVKPTNDKLDTKVINYCTLVQPVLDRYCVRCHSGVNPDGGYDLTGGKTRYFNMSYDNLLGRSRSYRQHDMQTGRILESEAQKGKPLVQFFWLLHTPSGVNQPLEAGTLASRLGDYLTKEHCEEEIPLSEKQKIYLWIDANAPYYPTYANSRPSTSGKRDLWAEGWYLNDFQEVYNRRCASCHHGIQTNENTAGPSQMTNNWTGRFAWINLSQPENSPALTAHLPKPLGRGVSTVSDKEEFLFKDQNDPDYQKMLRAIQVGKGLMESNPRADMPGFQHAKAEF